MRNLLIAVYVLFIAFLTATAIYGSHIFGGDVKNAYEKGMRYAEDQELIGRLGWQFSNLSHPLTQGVESQVELQVEDAQGAPLSGATVTMRLSRETKLGPVTEAVVREEAPGHYVGRLRPPFLGFYEVAATITTQGHTVPYRFSVYAAK